MYINSPGGSVTSGLAIYDTMQVGYSLVIFFPSLFFTNFIIFLWVGTAFCCTTAVHCQSNTHALCWPSVLHGFHSFICWHSRTKEGASKRAGDDPSAFWRSSGSSHRYSNQSTRDSSIA